jgi:uncharacterized protein
MNFYYKIHESHAGYLLAVCDKSICGKRLKEDNIEIHINPQFYKDKTATKKKIIELFKICSSANLIGNEIVQLAIDLGIIDKTGTKTINKIHYAQIIVMNI